MPDNVKVGREYDWVQDGKRVTVKVVDAPIWTAFEGAPNPETPMPTSELHCEVEVLSDGTTVVVPVSQLSNSES